jgi:hypothetical protein
MNSFPIKLKVYVGEIFKEPSLNRSIEACSTISDIYRTDREPLLKNSPN